MPSSFVVVDSTIGSDGTPCLDVLQGQSAERPFHLILIVIAIEWEYGHEVSSERVCPSSGGRWLDYTWVERDGSTGKPACRSFQSKPQPSSQRREMLVPVELVLLETGNVELSTYA